MRSRVKLLIRNAGQEAIPIVDDTGTNSQESMTGPGLYSGASIRPPVPRCGALPIEAHAQNARRGRTELKGGPPGPGNIVSFSPVQLPDGRLQALNATQKA